MTPSQQDISEAEELVARSIFSSKSAVEMFQLLLWAGGQMSPDDFGRLVVGLAQALASARAAGEKTGAERVVAAVQKCRNDERYDDEGSGTDNGYEGVNRGLGLALEAARSAVKNEL